MRNNPPCPCVPTVLRGRRVKFAGVGGCTHIKSIFVTQYLNIYLRQTLLLCNVLLLDNTDTEDKD